MPKGRRRDRRPAVDSVLAGATAVDAARLIGLINEINPTGRELPIPGAMWDRQRLDDLARRSRIWLTS